MSEAFTKLQRKSSGAELLCGSAAIEPAQLVHEVGQIDPTRVAALETAAVPVRGDVRGAVAAALRAREARAQPQLREMAQRVARARRACDRVSVHVRLELEQERRHRPA